MRRGGDFAEDEERNISWEIRTASRTAAGGGGEKKKHQLDKKEKKSVEQNKRRVQEMTSHSPLFPLLPRVVQETASGCRDTMGSAHIRCSPPQSVAGSLHRHDVLDKGCRWRPGQHREDRREGA